MHTGFKVHKQAVLLEYSLNRIMHQNAGNEVVDITMIYANPIPLIKQVLWKVEDKNKPLETRAKWIMQMIQERYVPYESYLLTQLEEPICISLCKDLEMLYEQMNIS